jgi:hypothetical protein
MTATEQKTFNISQQGIGPSLTVAGSSIVLSGPMKVDLSLYRGDTARFRVKVRNEDQTDFDTTGALWDADIRLKEGDVTTITSFEITPVPGDPSMIEVFLPSDSSDLISSNCVYDIEMRLSEEVTTLIYGKISVTLDVSRP